VYTVGNQIIEAILLHQEQDRERARELALDAMRLVGIPRPEQRIDEYPHQLSGGMLQRCMIAMALSCRPRVLIADEPTTAIDVTTQAQILQLMRDLQAELGMSIVMITHNLGVIAEMSERVLVMYMGKIVESASVRELFKKPLHPYTRALFKSIPVLGDESHVKQRLEAIAGAVPDAYNIPSGCAFHPRCPEFIPGRCDKVEPVETEPATDHTVLCHLFGGEEAEHG
jgi:peptide/nickel transport system ATP-binding protein